MEKYSSILVLKGKLENSAIPFNFRELYDGYQICYPNKDDMVYSVVEHMASYGSEDDQLEIMYGDSYEVEGYLTVNEVFEKIEKHFRG